jgi:Ca-activated chloride channel homolog
MTFAEPARLWLAAVIPLLVLAIYGWDRRRREALLGRLGDRALIARLSAAASPGRRALKAFILANAGAALAIALARPQVFGTKEVELRGLDIVVALDVSISMLVADVPAGAARPGEPITRLDLARQLIAELVDGLPGDRIGPVVFAAAAAHFPLTEDHEAAVRFFSDLGPADLPRGSNVAEALRVARCLLRRDLFDDLGCSSVIGRLGNGGRPLPNDRDADVVRPDPRSDDEEEIIEREQRGRVVIVVSDGGDDLASAVQEVRADKELGIAVLFVGVGSAEGGPVYEINEAGKRIAPKVDERGGPVISKRGDAEMKALAAAAGDVSRYLVADSTGDPTKKTKQKRDVFHPFVFAAILLLVIDAAISTRRRRRHPEAGAES